jgi:hypothetical protein
VFDIQDSDLYLSISIEIPGGGSPLFTIAQSHIVTEMLVDDQTVLPDQSGWVVEVNDQSWIESADAARVFQSTTPGGEGLVPEVTFTDSTLTCTSLAAVQVCDYLIPSNWNHTTIRATALTFYIGSMIRTNVGSTLDFTTNIANWPTQIPLESVTPPGLIGIHSQGRITFNEYAQQWWLDDATILMKASTDTGGAEAALMTSRFDGTDYIGLIVPTAVTRSVWSIRGDIVMTQPVAHGIGEGAHFTVLIIVSQHHDDLGVLTIESVTITEDYVNPAGLVDTITVTAVDPVLSSECAGLQLTVTQEATRGSACYWYGRFQVTGPSDFDYSPPM